MFSHDFGYVGLDAILGRMMYSKVKSISNTTFLMNKVNDYIFHLTELEDVNMYNFVAQFDVRYISKKDEVDGMKFVDNHPQLKFCWVVNFQNEESPIVNYLDFLDSETFNGNILDPSLTPTVATEQYAKTALCLFKPFRDLKLFMTPETGFSFTNHFQTMVEAGSISKTSLQQLQNIQDC